MANGQSGALLTTFALLLMLQGCLWRAAQALPAFEYADTAPDATAASSSDAPDAATAGSFTEPTESPWSPVQTAWPTDATAATDETTRTPDDDLTTMSSLWSEQATEAAAEAAMGGEEAEGGGPSEEQKEGNRTDGVLFKLYTRAHPITHHLLNSESLQGSDFDVGRRTVFVIHGFTGGPTADSVILLRDASLWAEDANVVVVDWETLAAGPHYAAAVLNTAVTAKALAARIEALAAAGLPLSLVHVVGFSLGAQVAGLAGARLNSTVGRLPRITGLDPARPGFDDKGDADRLDASDADLVVVLHTASGFVSFEQPLGHIDFYPNGGRSPQPPCRSGDSSPLVCSHLVAPRYFAEAIYKPQNFRGVHCGSWRDFESGLCAGRETAYLAMDMPTTTRGSFFLKTNPLEPYGRGDVDDASRASLDEQHEPGQHAHDEDSNALRTGRKHEPSAPAAATANTAPSSVSVPAALLLLGAAAAAMVVAAVVEP